MEQFYPSDRQGTPAPSPTPLPESETTPMPAAGEISAAVPSAALVDAAGLDIEERRIVDVYERVAPSVVSITTRVLRRNFFFEVTPEEGAGSGFVLDRQGHILTNYHVIAEAERIEVNFGEDTVYPARVVGLDRRNDIALIRVDAPAELLEPVELGTSANLRVGQRHRHRQSVWTIRAHADHGRDQRTGPYAGRAGWAHHHRHHPDGRSH